MSHLSGSRGQKKNIIRENLGRNLKYNTGKYDLILSNPPYIDKHQLKYLGVCEYEPYKALNGGIDGIEVLKKVILKASQLLKTNGKLIVEIGSNQKYKVFKASRFKP